MKRFLVFLCAVLLVFGVVANVQAIPLGDLFGGATITVGDKVFDDWERFSLDSSVMTDVTLIDVQPLADQPLNPGLQFTANGQLTVVDIGFIALDFGFSVSTLSGEPLIKDNSLEIPAGGFTLTGDGGFGIREEVFDPAGNVLAFKEVFAGLGQSEQLFAAEEFPPQAQIFVVKEIDVIGASTGDLVSLDIFEQRFSQVQAPEPATMLLLATGLAGLAGLRRKFKR